MRDPLEATLTQLTSFLLLIFSNCGLVDLMSQLDIFFSPQATKLRLEGNRSNHSTWAPC